MRRLPLFVCVSLFTLYASTAHASLMLAGLVNGVPFCAADNNAACGAGQLVDLDATIGRIQLGTTLIGGVQVSGSTHTQVIGPPQNVLNSQSLEIINNSGALANVAVSVGGIGYVGPTSSIELSGSGTWQNAGNSAANLQWYADPANGQGGQAWNDFPGILLYQQADVAGLGVDSFSTGSILVPFLAGGPFSMTTGFQMSLVNGGQLLSRGQTMISEVSAVPEPATMILMGTGLLAAFRARKKFRG
jgi:hypothetical protein